MLSLARLRQYLPIRPHELNHETLEQFARLANIQPCKVANQLFPQATEVAQAEANTAAKLLGMYCFHLHQYLTLKNTDHAKALEHQSRLDPLKSQLPPYANW